MRAVRSLGNSPRGVPSSVGSRSCYGINGQTLEGMLCKTVPRYILFGERNFIVTFKYCWNLQDQFFNELKFNL